MTQSEWLPVPGVRLAAVEAGATVGKLLFQSASNGRRWARRKGESDAGRFVDDDVAAGAQRDQAASLRS